MWNRRVARALRPTAAPWIVLLLVLGTAAGVPPVEDEALVVTFLGNEGFLLESNGRKVLIDALVSPESTAYVRQADELREKLEGGEAPFDEVELVLATHVHGDHFDAAAVARHLRANPQARFVSTPQAVARLRAEDGFAALSARVTAVGPADGEAERVDDLMLDALAMHHGRDRRPLIENDAFLFELGDWRILHMGDSECSAEELAAFGLDEADIDVALVPSWYLDAGPWKGAIEAEVAPAHTLVMHLAPDWKREAETPNQRESRACVARIRAAHPEAIVFEEALEVRRFKSASD